MCASAMKCKQAQYYSLFAGFTRIGLCWCSAGSEWRQGRILFALRLKNVHVVINQMHLFGAFVLFSHLCLARNIRAFRCPLLQIWNSGSLALGFSRWYVFATFTKVYCIQFHNVLRQLYWHLLLCVIRITKHRTRVPRSVKISILNGIAI